MKKIVLFTIVMLSVTNIFGQIHVFSVETKPLRVVDIFQPSIDVVIPINVNKNFSIGPEFSFLKNDYRGSSGNLSQSFTSFLGGVRFSYAVILSPTFSISPFVNVGVRNSYFISSGNVFDRYWFSSYGGITARMNLNAKFYLALDLTNYYINKRKVRFDFRGDSVSYYELPKILDVRLGLGFKFLIKSI
ncbi:hypothetical protein SAMN05661096_03488 [Marivirga sericea]|uniref:Outer membrane protein beta-barrel domain-containing protein n=1 Tax=Marivirga sericea TaxID=1028 RepID=A0A1X7L473_9BACT|nr:hypothetical protein [Marivirga sericea]SMG48550.1 hypothetical protein SAMN05661096_03488 [Marivirga sericea]